LVPAAGDPFAYVTPDGGARVLYVGADFDIHELRFQGSWLRADLSAPGALTFIRHGRSTERRNARAILIERLAEDATLIGTLREKG
jgi:hypothetical protein